MSKEIWLPDSETHVTVEDGRVRIWETMTMTKQSLQKRSFGLSFDEAKIKEDILELDNWIDVR